MALNATTQIHVIRMNTVMLTVTNCIDQLILFKNQVVWVRCGSRAA